MSLITWDNSFSVNVAQIDVQHKKLVDLINFFHNSMKSGKSNIIMGKALQDLVDYTKYHFTSEEKLMEKAKYNGLALHKMQHAKFVKKVDDLNQRHKNGEKIVSMEVMNFLKEWLTNHILGSDHKYSSAMNDAGIH